MSNVIMPEENVKYTFAFSPTKKMVYRWYGDYKVKQNGQLTGRLMFYNETTERYTDMTLSYFRYLCRRHLVEKMPIDCEGYDLKGMPVKKEKPKPPEPKVKKEPEMTEREANIELANIYLKEMNSITEQEKYRVKCEYGDAIYNATEISRNLKNIIKDKLTDKEEIEKVFSTSRRLYTIICRYRADNPLQGLFGKKPPEPKVKKQPEKTECWRTIERANIYLEKINSITEQEKDRVKYEFRGDAVSDVAKISNNLKSIIKDKLTDKEEIEKVFSTAVRLYTIICGYRACKPLHSSLRRITL